ncbi:hypothetical protein HpHA225_15370 [Helicobacter pylori]
MIANFEGLKNIVSVVDVVEKYLDLYKCGVNFKTCCPFHDERSASFFVMIRSVTSLSLKNF